MVELGIPELTSGPVFLLFRNSLLHFTLFPDFVYELPTWPLDTTVRFLLMAAAVVPLVISTYLSVAVVVVASWVSLLPSLL